MSARGWWAVVETGQGGGLPDHLHGPFWGEAEATAAAADLAADMRAVGRHDRFDVASLERIEDES